MKTYTFLYFKKGKLKPHHVSASGYSATEFSCRLQGKRANKARKMPKELMEDDSCEKSQNQTDS
jgi:hypothetical protein